MPRCTDDWALISETGAAACRTVYGMRCSFFPRNLSLRAGKPDRDTDQSKSKSRLECQSTMSSVLVLQSSSLLGQTLSLVAGSELSPVQSISKIGASSVVSSEECTGHRYLTLEVRDKTAKATGCLSVAIKLLTVERSVNHVESLMLRT